VKYELGFYIPEDDILHSHRREHLKSYIILLVGEHGNPCPVLRWPFGRIIPTMKMKTMAIIMTT
jgi:hypothetical protein